jgi:methylmalonyl-CoA mutase cobalamin-binding subunit
MSSAGRAANSSGCVTTPKEREIGLNGFAAQIRFSSFTGSYGMATADHREPCESRGSRTVLGAPGGEIPPGDSTIADNRGTATFLVAIGVTTDMSNGY